MAAGLAPTGRALAAPTSPPGAARERVLALLTPHDLTSAGVPVERVTAALTAALENEGFRVLPMADVDAILERNRVRWMGGVSQELARAFGEEAGVGGILVTTVTDWDDAEPPRVALVCRWVAADANARLLWVDGVGLHGGEHPGAFDTGLVTDVNVLLDRAAFEMAASLAVRRGPDRGGVARRFRPRTFAVDRGLAAPPAGETRRVAVLPFVTDGPRREIGELVALEFTRQLFGARGLEVLEPGVVRQVLLDARVIQQDGVSLPQVATLKALLDVDLVVSGFVSDFEIQGLGPRTPFAGFSARAVESESHQAVWTSFSFARGDDGLRLFDSRRIRSAARLTSELVRGVVEKVDRHNRRGRSKPQPAPSKKGKS